MTYKIQNKEFIELSSGNKLQTIEYDTGNFSSSWLEKQEASYEEYEETHERGNYPEYVLSFFSYFRNVISEYSLQLLTNQREINILDIGCGISRKIPIYVPQSRYINYIGLDPIKKNRDREYPFICSRLENLSVLLEPDSIDIFLFSTSLDHFEEIDSIYGILKKVAKEKSYIIISSGMHDTSIISTWTAYNNIKITNQFEFKKGVIARLKYLKRLILFSKSMMDSYHYFSERSSKIENNVPLDKLHFHYFQYQSYIDFLKNKMGKLIENKIIEPGNVVITVNEIIHE